MTNYNQQLKDAYSLQDWEFIRKLSRKSEIRYPRQPNLTNLHIIIEALGKEISEVSTIVPRKIKPRPIGKIFRYFRFEELLGSGITGKVFLVEKDNKKQIIKISHTDRKTLIREFNILKYLSSFLNCHRLIICVKDLFEGTYENKKYVGFSMEYIPKSQELYNLTSNDKVIPYSTIRNVMKALLMGIEYIHFKGIIHGDLKPDNILFTPDGIIKIIDFGMARFYESVMQDIRIGYAPYLPPEFTYIEKEEGTLIEIVFDIDKPVFKSPKIDIWAIGIILLELLSKKVLEETIPFFNKPTETNIGKRDIESMLTKEEIEKIPTDLKKLLYGLLEDDPIKRLSASEALKNIIKS